MKTKLGLFLKKSIFRLFKKNYKTGICLQIWIENGKISRKTNFQTVLKKIPKLKKSDFWPKAYNFSDYFLDQIVLLCLFIVFES
jgi:hypothetical protein